MSVGGVQAATTFRDSADVVTIANAAVAVVTIGGTHVLLEL